MNGRFECEECEEYSCRRAEAEKISESDLRRARTEYVVDSVDDAKRVLKGFIRERVAPIEEEWRSHRRESHGRNAA